MKLYFARLLLIVLCLLLAGPALWAEPQRPEGMTPEKIEAVRQDIGMIKLRLKRAREAKKMGEVRRLEQQLMMLEQRLSMLDRVAPPPPHGPMHYPGSGPDRHPTAQRNFDAPRQLLTASIGYQNNFLAAAEIAWPRLLSPIGLHRITGAHDKGFSLGLTYIAPANPAGTVVTIVPVEVNIFDSFYVSSFQTFFLKAGINIPVSVSGSGTGLLGGQAVIGTRIVLGAGQDRAYVTGEIGYGVIRTQTLSIKNLLVRLGYTYAF